MGTHSKTVGVTVSYDQSKYGVANLGNIDEPQLYDRTLIRYQPAQTCSHYHAQRHAKIWRRGTAEKLSASRRALVMKLAKKKRGSCEVDVRLPSWIHSLHSARNRKPKIAFQ